MKRSILITSSFIAVLCTSLIIHIRMVARGAADGHLARVQLAAITLEAPVAADAAAAIKSAVLAAPGVQHCYVNAQAGTIAFGYHSERGTTQTVLRAVRQASPVAAELREPLAGELARSCPVRVPKGLLGWHPFR